MLAEKAITDTGRSLPSYAAPVLAFFLGGCLVLLILILYEAYRWQKSSYP
jgi:hypothetical protein